MKRMNIPRYFWLLALLGLAMAGLPGCDEDSDPSLYVTPREEPEPDPTDPANFAGKKKGACFTINGPTWSTRVSRLGSHWHYSWGNTLSEYEPDNVDFVPMIWGRGAATDENVARLKSMAEAGQITYLLGFNEPDKEDQANMSVDEAIELWPKLEEVGVPLGSPACANPSGEWMAEFMQRAAAEGLRVDFVCVHNYPGPNVQAFKDRINGWYAQWDLPIWITEFAIADWDATTIEENRHSEATVLAFMEEVLPWLESVDYVQRFSWFNGDESRPPLYTSALFDEDDNLTALGQYYADFMPNEDVGAGFDPPVEDLEDPDNLLSNGAFESGEIAPWQGFKNGVVNSGVSGGANTGEYCARIENNDGSIYQVLSLDPEKHYEISFWAKWSETVENTFSMAVRSEIPDNPEPLLHQVEVPITDGTTWVQAKDTFQIPAGESSVRILFYKPNGQGHPPLNLDDIVLKEVDGGSGGGGGGGGGETLGDNLIANNGFETGTVDSWGGFKNGAVDNATTEPYAGTYSGRIENNDGSLFQEFTVTAGATYRVTFWSKWLSEPPTAPATVFNNVVQDRTGGANNGNLSVTPIPLDNSPLEWQQTEYEVTVPEGVTTVRLVFFKPANQGYPPFVLDEVEFREVM